MTLNELRKHSEEARTTYCADCPRHPNLGYKIYAEGCKIHQSEKPQILFLWRDPSSPQNPNIIGCSDDSRVCPWCHTDQSAKNFQNEIYPELVKLVPELDKDRFGKYPVYCLNAVFHGPEKNEKPPAGAIKCCSNVVREYLHHLKPSIVVALGKNAQRSLKWIAGVNTEKDERPVTVDSITYFWTFHPSPLAFNQKRNVIMSDIRELAGLVKEKMAEM